MTSKRNGGDGVPGGSGELFRSLRHAQHRRAVGIRGFALGVFVMMLNAVAADPTTLPATLRHEPGRIVIETGGAPLTAPTYFSAEAEHTVRISEAEIAGEIRLKIRVVQSRPEIVTLGLSGDGDIVEVVGSGLRDWSVRQEAGASGQKRLLDLRLISGSEATTATRVKRAAEDLDFTVRTRQTRPAIPGSHALLLVTRGEAVGFASKIRLEPAAAIDLRVRAASGVTPLAERSEPRAAMEFFATSEARLEVELATRGAATREAELFDAHLAGVANEATRSVEFRLRAQVRATKAGARLRLLSGAAALSERAAGDGWHVELARQAGGDREVAAYDLICARAGVMPVDVRFVAAVRESEGWQTMNFTMPAGAVVPLRLSAIEANADFKPDGTVVPVATPQGWQGFVPADGRVLVAWKTRGPEAEGTLFFTSQEQTEVRIGAGVMRQWARVTLRTLQGELKSARCRLDGAGEIVAVDGPNVVGWSVERVDGRRTLEVRFSRPIDSESTLTIQSQAELGSWPARLEPLRIAPEGTVRHSGWVRIANDGAVRLEVTDTTGMMQLAPGQFPGGPVQTGARHVLVYRFPSAAYAYSVVADQIQPEVAVSMVATYELADAARAIEASIELDIREAPLRDFMWRIPEDYAVVSVTGAEVADFTAESTAENGTRPLRILFGHAVEGRQLIQVRLEKNEGAAAGLWRLPPIGFPSAKSVRGHVGVVSAPGYRVVPVSVTELTEVPVSFFPRQMTGLQQGWRLRTNEWAAQVRIESLEQSIQADVFHLYSVHEGVVRGSVLMNYFVVGAPATEWRIAAPARLGNVDVVGQNVRRDWRREGDQLIVTLHQPVLGAGSLLVTFEQPIGARGAALSPGEVRPVGVQSERGYVQVVSPLQVKHDIVRAEGSLLKLEPGELPTEFRLLTSSPSLALYQYTARPFALELQVEWHAPGETVEQVVDFATLASRVSRNGEVVTEARYFVKTRGRKPLRLVLPPGAKLWEAQVDGEVVNARADGDQTSIPLAARTNPNEPVNVFLRIAQPAPPSGSNVVLAAPRIVSAPTVASDWVVRSDAGRLLVPRGGTVELNRQPLTETGFEWITTRGAVLAVAMLLATAFGLLLVRSGGGRTPMGVGICALVVFGWAALAVQAAVNRRVNSGELSYAGTMAPAGEATTLEVANLPRWRAMVVDSGIVAAVGGLALVTFGRRRQRLRPFTTAIGASLLFAGILAQRGGAALCFAVASAAVLYGLALPAFHRWRLQRREIGAGHAPPLSGPSAGASASINLFVLATMTAALVIEPPTAHAASVPEVRVGESSAGPIGDVVKPAQAMVQRWMIREGRVFAEAEVTVRGQVGDSFVLLRAPAVLTEFVGDGLRVTKSDGDQGTYFVAPEREGLLAARLRFEMPAENMQQGLALPTGRAGVQRLSVELDEAGWDFVSGQAVHISPVEGLAATRSGATLVFVPEAAPMFQVVPRRRDLGTETTRFFADTANLYLPGPGVVSIVARVTIRPVQGRVSALEIEVPTGFTVGDVRGPVARWRFDPGVRRLHVNVEPPQSAVFRIEVEAQRGAGEMPFRVVAEPLRVQGAAADGGMIALAFGSDAQPEAMKSFELSPVNVQDFDAALVPRAPTGQPMATLHQAWRYGDGGGRVELMVAPVAPEVRVSARQVVSIDDDRLVMGVDLQAAITRAGLFKMSFAMPAGLELEAVSGAALAQWTEAQEGAQRIVTLHLNGRTVGTHDFHLSLVGTAPTAQTAWPLPRLLVREAVRHTGEAVIVPGRGIRVHATTRERVTEIDPRSVGALQPGALAFRLLQGDSVLMLGIENLDPWVTVQALQDVTFREGQTLTRIAVRCRVENAAVKALRVRLPGLTEETVRTVRATGAAVSDFVRLDEADLWELRFQRGVAGEADVQIEFQSLAPAGGIRDAVDTPQFLEARQSTHFVAVRSAGRLEVEPGAAPRGWTPVDWSAVPAVLTQRGERGAPAFGFRVAEPEGPLPIALRRHDVADALTLRVTQGTLTTLFAPGGAFVTALDLQIEVLQTDALAVRLPPAARLFNTFVNGESVAVVRVADAWIFHVKPSSNAGRNASVKLVYSAQAPANGVLSLAGPRLSVPLENATWRVVLPPGYELDDYRGDLRLRTRQHASAFGVSDYQRHVEAKRSAEAQASISLLQHASAWLQQGHQEKAAEALSQVSNTLVLDEAANEDARVQLRNLKTQQAVVSLHTRRQRLYLDNRADAFRNEQLEQAANANPLMQGKTEFSPRELDRLLLGNTPEENAALRGIAARIVDQQLAEESAAGAIEVTLPERGRVCVFTRGVHVDGGTPLELILDFRRVQRANGWLSALLILGAAGLVGAATGVSIGGRRAEGIAPHPSTE